MLFCGEICEESLEWPSRIGLLWSEMAAEGRAAGENCQEDSGEPCIMAAGPGMANVLSASGALFTPRRVERVVVEAGAEAGSCLRGNDGAKVRRGGRLQPPCWGMSAGPTAGSSDRSLAMPSKRDSCFRSKALISGSCSFSILLVNVSMAPDEIMDNLPRQREPPAVALSGTAVGDGRHLCAQRRAERPSLSGPSLVTSIALQNVARGNLDAALDPRLHLARYNLRDMAVVGGAAVIEGAAHVAVATVVGRVGQRPISKGPAHVSAGGQFVYESGRRQWRGSRLGWTWNWDWQSSGEGSGKLLQIVWK